MLGMAQASTWPHAWPPIEHDKKKAKWRLGHAEEMEKALGVRDKALSMRMAHGPLEVVASYDGPHGEAVRDYWWLWTAAAGRLGQAGFAPPVPMPQQPTLTLAGSICDPREQPPAGWRCFIASAHRQAGSPEVRPDPAG